MDAMNIKSKFLTGIISKVVSRVLRKKLGYDINVRVNEVETTVGEYRTRVHLNLDAEMSKDELVKLLSNLGLD